MSQPQSSSVSALPSARPAKRPPCQAPALPSARPAKRPPLARLAEKQWALTGLGLALLVLLVLPSAQIKLGASQLNGLIGSYTGGHYWDITYNSQGTTSYTEREPGGNVSTDSLAWNSADSSFALSPTSGLDAKCVGMVMSTLTWVPATGQTSATDPPPSQVLITETGSAYFNGGGVHSDHGTLNDGWSADTPPDSPGNIYGPHYYYSASGTHTEVKDGTSGTITLGPFSLNASTPAVTDSTVGNDTVAVSASVTIAQPAPAPTITLTGPTPDSNGNLNILIGQGCKAALVGAPSGTTCVWKVTGITFQEWQDKDPANSQASYYVDGSGTLTNTTAHWFWNDPGPAATPETVTCTATVTPPDGKAAPYKVTVTQNVTVQVPTWTASGIGGYVQINADCPDATPQGAVLLWAGPFLPIGQNDAHSGGMDWTATCMTPQMPVAFGTGTLELVQLATPNRAYTTNTASPVKHTYIRPKGLDSYYPYYTSHSAYVEGGPAYATYDDPRMPTDDVNAGSVIMSETFDDYLLYLPPGTDTRWVPLANFTWTTNMNGSATIPKPSNLWVNYKGSGTPSDKAGTVSVGGITFTNPPTKVKFTAYHIHPSWTLINLFEKF